MSDDGGILPPPDDVFGDHQPDPVDEPALRDVAERVRRAMQGDQLRSEVRDDLRARLVAARADVIAEHASSASATVVPIAARRRGRPLLTWVAVGAAAAVIAAVVVDRSLTSDNGRAVAVAASSDVIGAVSVDPASGVRLQFSEALDHDSTAAAVHLTPAATLGATWQGDTLTVAPTHGFAANSPYVLTIDHNVARTAGGRKLAADVHVVFGTAPEADTGPASTPPVSLLRAGLSAAADGSEAVVAGDESVLLTAATPTAGGSPQGLVRVSGGKATEIAAAIDAICVSRSGQSIAYLSREPSGAQVVFADRGGTPLGHVAVNADPSTPIGWIDDTEVSFVSQGRLQAVNRSGTVRLLSDTTVDPSHDDLAIAPGGRYVYLATTASAGRVIDLQSGTSHPLAGITGGPAFSADGATVVWVQGDAPDARLASAPSDGGPTTLAPFGLQAGDTVGDMGVSPDGSRLVYSVTGADGHAQLRLASLPDGTTLAVSDAGAGESPNWSPTGRRFTVLGQGAGGSEIEVVDVPSAALDQQAAFEATARAFAFAQLGGDSKAQAALTADGVVVPPAPSATRAAVLWVQPASDGSVTAHVRLSVDPTMDDPVARQADEVLTLGAKTGSGVPVVTGISLGSLSAASPGPAVTNIDTDAVPGSVVVTFDSDLDPTTVSSAVTLTAPGGAAIAATTTYDPAARAISVRPGAPGTTDATVSIVPSLKDVAGRALPARVDVSIRLAPAS